MRVRVMISCMVLSSAAVNLPWPMRLAGTWKQYSMKAMPQLANIAIQRGLCLKRRWPYHANVMKTLDMMRRTTVCTKLHPPSGAGLWPFFLFAEGSMSSAVIPVLSEYQKKNPDKVFLKVALYWFDA
jgi:hypothetical protein